MAEPKQAYFTRDGERFVPTGLAPSPWNKAAQSGVALAGLAGHVIDQTPTLSPMITTRMTLDILGAVPIVPLIPTVRIVRDGKRMQTLEVEIRTDERVYVRASALRVREGESPDRNAPLSLPLPKPEDPRDRGLPWFESVRVRGSFLDAGPGAIWIRLKNTIVQGEPLSPLSAMGIIADFGGGTAPLVPTREWTMANLDLSVYMTRRPVGEWFLVDAVADGSGTGLGVARSQISDIDGMFATALQTVFLDRRPEPLKVRG
jgi:hypothetical protein